LELDDHHINTSTDGNTANLGAKFPSSKRKSSYFDTSLNGNSALNPRKKYKRSSKLSTMSGQDEDETVPLEFIPYTSSAVKIVDTSRRAATLEGIEKELESNYYNALAAHHQSSLGTSDHAKRDSRNVAHAHTRSAAEQKPPLKSNSAMFKGARRKSPSKTVDSGVQNVHEPSKLKAEQVAHGNIAKSTRQKRRYSHSVPCISNKDESFTVVSGLLAVVRQSTNAEEHISTALSSGQEESQVAESKHGPAPITVEPTGRKKSVSYTPVRDNHTC